MALHGLESVETVAFWERQELLLLLHGVLCSLSLSLSVY